MKKIDEIITEYFGYSLKKEQREIIELIMNGIDTIGLLPTGFGKSVTYQIPALLFDGVTLVVSPLIALMQDQVSSLKEKGIKAEYINSLQTKEEQEIIYNKLINNKIKLLYVSAERLKSKRFIETITKLNISLFVCDEAHTLLWSEDFREALGEIPNFLRLLSKRPKMLALTATATTSTITKIINLLDLNNPQIIKGNCDRLNIFYRNIKTTNKDKELLNYLSTKRNIHGLIYCLTIKNCDYVYSLLKSNNYNVALYYGTMDSSLKKKTQIKYKNHEIDIIIATNAFGMGIDVPDIRFVILYDLPQSLEDYLQQTGRASRDNEYAEGVLLFNIKDIDTISHFIENINQNDKTIKELKQIKNDRYNKLNKMINFSLSKKCLHQQISEYFGIPHKGKCMMCSNCIKKK